MMPRTYICPLKVPSAKQLPSLLMAQQLRFLQFLEQISRELSDIFHKLSVWLSPPMALLALSENTNILGLLGTPSSWPMSLPVFTSISRRVLSLKYARMMLPERDSRADRMFDSRLIREIIWLQSVSKITSQSQVTSRARGCQRHSDTVLIVRRFTSMVLKGWVEGCRGKSVVLSIQQCHKEFIYMISKLEVLLALLEHVRELLAVADVAVSPQAVSKQVGFVHASVLLLRLSRTHIYGLLRSVGRLLLSRVAVPTHHPADGLVGHLRTSSEGHPLHNGASEASAETGAWCLLHGGLGRSLGSRPTGCGGLSGGRGRRSVAATSEAWHQNINYIRSWPLKYDFQNTATVKINQKHPVLEFNAKNIDQIAHLFGKNKSKQSLSPRRQKCLYHRIKFKGHNWNFSQKE